MFFWFTRDSNLSLADSEDGNYNMPIELSTPTTRLTKPENANQLRDLKLCKNLKIKAQWDSMNSIFLQREVNTRGLQEIFESGIQRTHHVDKYWAKKRVIKEQ